MPWRTSPVPWRPRTQHRRSPDPAEQGRHRRRMPWTFLLPPFLGDGIGAEEEPALIAQQLPLQRVHPQVPQHQLLSPPPQQQDSMSMGTTIALRQGGGLVLGYDVGEVEVRMRLAERRWSWVVMLRYDPRELERARMTTLECGSGVAGMSSLSQRNTPHLRYERRRSRKGIHFVRWRQRVFCRASSCRCHRPTGCPATSSCWPSPRRFCIAGGCGSPRSRASAAPTAPTGSSCFSSRSSSPPPSPR